MFSNDSWLAVSVQAFGRNDEQRPRVLVRRPELPFDSAKSLGPGFRDFSIVSVIFNILFQYLTMSLCVARRTERRSFEV